MAWTFRKKIKIAPGVHINLSKSGVSTSIGPRGAKVTIGPKGTYLHTGIPGTGIYNRRKLGTTPQSGIPSTTLRQSSSVSNYSRSSKPSKNKGCLNLFIWVLCIVSGVLVFGGILNIVDVKSNIQLKNIEYNQFIAQQNSSEDINQTADETLLESKKVELRDEIDQLQYSLTVDYILIAFYIVLFIFSVIRLVKHTTFKSSKSLDDKALKSGHTSANKEAINDEVEKMHDVEQPKIRDRDFDFTPDDLLKDAAARVVATQNASTSVLQRYFAIGYNRASRIMDQLEKLGIVSPYMGIKPREVLVKNISELENNLASFYNSVQITEQYFNDLLSAAKRLLKFGEKLANNLEFCQLVNNNISDEIKLNGKVLTEGKDKIPIILWADVVHCYMGLGHEVDLSSNEGLGLLVYSLLMADSKFPIEYRSLDFVKTNLKDSCQTFIRDGIASMRGNTDRFMIEECLKGFDTPLHNQYVVFLYRFTSLIAKADGKISGEESGWLNKIMALKIPEGEDVITPTDSLKDEKNVKKRETAKRSHSNAAKELESLIGLTSVKSEITSLTNYIKVQKMREEKGMKVTPVSLHCVFTGNPGTGKTTVARIVAEIYKELGLLKKGHLIETDRSGLVAEYVGQTAVKTNKIIDSALDGILFIDEAYSLVDGGNSDYGKEAIATLLKRMEDERERLVVILAGYTNDMKRFIDSNPGLQSRFNRYIEFPDYSIDELYQIFCSNMKKYEYTLDDDAQAALKEVFENAVANKDKNFGNGRFVRNLFEKVVEHQANRLSAEAAVTAETLMTIKGSDIRN